VLRTRIPQSAPVIIIKTATSLRLGIPTCALLAAQIEGIPLDTGEACFTFIAALNFVDGAKLPGCPAVPPEGCLRAYQRMGMVAQLAARLRRIRSVIEERWHEAGALDDVGHCLCVAAPSLFAMANHTSYDGVLAASTRPVAAARELLAHPDALETVAALACMPGDVHPAMHAGGPRLMLGCAHARTVLLVLNETLSKWQLDAPSEEEACLAEESRREYARLLNSQLACMEGVLLLKAAGGTSISLNGSRRTCQAGTQAAFWSRCRLRSDRLVGLCVGYVTRTVHRG
jgi:hypothetical protein